MARTNSEQVQEKAPPHVNLFGILIERKTNILAFSAFLLSLLSVITQLYFFARGPDIKIFPPEQVLLMSHAYANSKSYLRIASRMAYVNRGQTGNDVIMQETVSFKLGNTTYEQRWQDYTESSGEGAKLNMKRKGDALPVSISAGSATAHETWFAPRTVRKQGIHPGINFLEMDEFLKALERQNELKLDFSFRTYGNNSGSMECLITVDDNLRSHLKKKGWSAPSCEIKS